MDPASDEVLDLIGAIAMHRQAMEQDSGAVPARSEALRKLNALLAHERDELQLHGSSGRHAANVAAVMLELVKVRNSPDRSAAQAGYSRRTQMGPGSQRHRSRRNMTRDDR